MGEKKVKRTGQGGMFNDKSGEQLPLAMQYDYTNFYFGAGDDAFAMLEPFDEWWKDSEPSGMKVGDESSGDEETSSGTMRTPAVQLRAEDPEADPSS